MGKRLSNEERMDIIGQVPHEKHHMTEAGTFTACGETVTMYRDEDLQESHDLYLDIMEVKEVIKSSQHGKYFIIKALSDRGVMYPDIVYGHDTTVWQCSTAYITCDAMEVFIDLKECGKFHDEKEELAREFRKAIKNFTGASVVSEQDFEKAPESAKVTENTQQAKVWHEDLTESEGEVYIPESDFKMYDDEDMKTKLLRNELHTLSHSTLDLNEEVNELMQENERLREENQKLQDAAKCTNVGVPCGKNLPSKIAYETADRMLAYPYNIYAVLYVTLMEAISIERVSIRNKPSAWHDAWEEYESCLRKELDKEGISLVDFDMDHEPDNKLTKQEFDDRDRTRPKINSTLSYYACNGLGCGKQCLRILKKFLEGKYDGSISYLIDGVKRYFHLTDTNAAIHWLNRFGLKIPYQED